MICNNNMLNIFSVAYKMNMQPADAEAMVRALYGLLQNVGTATVAHKEPKKTPEASSTKKPSSKKHKKSGGVGATIISIGGGDEDSASDSDSGSDSSSDVDSDQPATSLMGDNKQPPLEITSTKLADDDTNSTMGDKRRSPGKHSNNDIDLIMDNNMPKIQIGS